MIAGCLRDRDQNEEDAQSKAELAEDHFREHELHEFRKIFLKLKLWTKLWIKTLIQIGVKMQASRLAT